MSMPAERARKLLALIVLLSWLLACGGDASTAAAPDGPIRGDGGMNRDDAGERDGGGGDTDGGNDIISGETYLCRYDDDDIATLDAHDTQRGLSSATNEVGFALLRHDADGALVVDAVQVGRPAQPAVRLVPAASAPGRALIAASQDAFAMAFMAGDALSVRALEAGAEPYVLSEAVVAGGSDAELFDLIGQGDGYLAIYAEQDGGEIVVRVQAIDASGAPDGDPASVELPEGTEPGHIALSKLDEGYLLAFSELDPEAEDSARVMGIALSAALEADGEPVLLSKTPVDQLAFGLDARAGSAGLLYQGLEGGVRPTVKLQRVEPDGSAEQDSLNVTSAPLRAIDGSIAAFGQGYAVAYRAQMSLGAETPSIRIAFVNQFGLVVHDAELAETTEEAGTTSVSSTADGKLLVSWISVDGLTPVARAIQLDCPGALQLCGGKVD
jgi:hypothetical protein